MPFYEIIVQIKSTSASTGGQDSDVKEIRVVRNWPSNDLDRLYLACSANSRKMWGDSLVYFDCQMISKHSPIYQHHLDEMKRLKKEKDRRLGR